MLIECPACARSYHVSRAEIGEDGRTVICPRCDSRWFVDSDGAGTLIPPEAIRISAIGGGKIIEHDETSRPPLWQRARPAAAFAFCLVVAMGLVAARTEVVRLVPRSSGLYAAIHLAVNLRGLEITSLAPARGADAASDLTISGEIRNVAQKRVGVPRLTFEIRDAAGTALVSWTERAPAKTLGTGKTLPFASSPHRLPADARSILVRFESDEDEAPRRMARLSAN